MRCDKAANDKAGIHTFVPKIDLKGESTTGVGFGTSMGWKKRRNRADVEAAEAALTESLQNIADAEAASADDSSSENAAETEPESSTVLGGTIVQASHGGPGPHVEVDPASMLTTNEGGEVTLELDIDDPLRASAPNRDSDLIGEFTQSIEEFAVASCRQYEGDSGAAPGCRHDTNVHAEAPGQFRHAAGNEAVETQSCGSSAQDRVGTIDIVGVA